MVAGRWIVVGVGEVGRGTGGWGYGGKPFHSWELEPLRAGAFFTFATYKLAIRDAKNTRLLASS